MLGAVRRAQARWASSLGLSMHLTREEESPRTAGHVFAANFDATPQEAKNSYIYWARKGTSDPAWCREDAVRRVRKSLLPVWVFDAVSTVTVHADVKQGNEFRPARPLHAEVRYAAGHEVTQLSAALPADFGGDRAVFEQAMCVPRRFQDDEFAAQTPSAPVLPPTVSLHEAAQAVATRVHEHDCVQGDSRADAAFFDRGCANVRVQSSVRLTPRLLHVPVYQVDSEISDISGSDGGITVFVNAIDGTAVGVASASVDDSLSSEHQRMLALASASTAFAVLAPFDYQMLPAVVTAAAVSLLPLPCPFWIPLGMAGAAAVTSTAAPFNAAILAYGAARSYFYRPVDINGKTIAVGNPSMAATMHMRASKMERQRRLYTQRQHMKHVREMYNRSKGRREPRHQTRSTYNEHDPRTRTGSGDSSERDRWYRHAMSQQVRDRRLYDALHVSPSASQKEIAASYRSLVKKHHPDMLRNASKAQEEYSKEVYHRVTQAFHVLGNKKRRQEYDRTGRVKT